ncbi:MAG: hypothetical protein EOO10_25725 [Chitinophagaceae bacterium]|nr:MAG: hypothetical protein EOO10_25725 [Chitinophagaceae bacterium]
MEIISSEKKTCINCKGIIKGRTDKKFCNENCRNSFNNRLHADRNNLIRNINNALGRNRRILAEFAGEDGKARDIPFQKLLNRGYHLNFSTHKVHCKKGREFVFCYDHGFHRRNDDRCIIVKQPSRDV